MDATLTWNVNASSEAVTSYGIYWGFASANYTGSTSPIGVNGGSTTSYQFSAVTSTFSDTVFFALSAFNANGESGLSDEVVKIDSFVPTKDGWGGGSTCLASGSTGEWDRYLTGAVSPTPVFFRGSTYLYYIGASSFDVGEDTVTHRKMGVATSEDGINFTKYSSNPILSYSPTGDIEEGIWSMAFLVEASTLHMWYGAISSFAPGGVDIHVRYASSADGFSFGGDTSVYSEVSSEVGPLGVVKLDNIYHIYTHSDVAGSPKKLYHMSSVSVSSGFTTSVQMTQHKVIYGGQANLLNSNTILMHIIQDQTGAASTRRIEARPISVSNLDSLGNSVVTDFTFDDVPNNQGIGTLYVSSINTWYNYQVSGTTTTSQYDVHVHIAASSVPQFPPATLSNFTTNTTEVEDGCTAATVSTNEVGGRIYYAPVTNGGAATNTQISTGQGGDIPISAIHPFASSVAVTASGTITLPVIRGLKHGTNYQLWAFQQDPSGTDSEQISTNLITTNSTLPLGRVIYDNALSSVSVSNDWFFYESNSSKFLISSGVLQHTSITNVSTFQGQLMMGFGKLPTASTQFNYFVPNGVNSTRVYSDVTVTFDHRILSPWTQSGGFQHLCRIVSFGESSSIGSVGQEPARVDVYWMNPEVSSSDSRFTLEMQRGVSLTTTDVLSVTSFDDTANKWFPGQATGSTQPYGSSFEDQWTQWKIRFRLNQFGEEFPTGKSELWINGILDNEKTDIQIRGAYSSFGINAFVFERKWAHSAPTNSEVSQFRNLRIWNNLAEEPDVRGKIVRLGRSRRRFKLD